ncbi:Flagellum-specific ATP synthase [compost metagenome]
MFAELPELCERCGTAPGGGSITALLTVLVEGDDFNEPVSDALRAILDGHIVLTRQLAHRGHYPAIDVLKSVSRLMPELADMRQRQSAAAAVQHLAVLERNRQMIDIGAYEQGSNPELDRAIALEPQLMAWLRQDTGGVPLAQALKARPARQGPSHERDDRIRREGRRRPRLLLCAGAAAPTPALAARCRAGGTGPCAARAGCHRGPAVAAARGP